MLREGNPTLTMGYCFVSSRAEPPGIGALLREEEVNRNYAIPGIIDDLEVYFTSARTIGFSMPVSQSPSV